jgi:hypothetical protein
MNVRWDIEAKLAAASEWVRAEYADLANSATEMGCDTVAESGPGTSLRLNGRSVVRLHPKRTHLALGFPDDLRDDVDTLTGALRAQRGAAWLNYTSEVCDRETVQMLIGKAVSIRQHAPPARGPTRAGAVARSGGTVGIRDDDRDLQLLLDVLRAFHRYADASGRQPAVKVIREAMFFHWEGPRLPPGGKYSPLVPHTPAARARKEAGHRDGFVLEHVLPVNLLIKQLLADLPADADALRQRLEAATDRVVITKEEDSALIAAGVGSSVPTPGDPWSRYTAAGMDPTLFAALA